MMPESKNFDNNLSLSIYYASFQLKKKFLPGQRFCPRQIATVKYLRLYFSSSPKKHEDPTVPQDVDDVTVGEDT